MHVSACRIAEEAEHPLNNRPTFKASRLPAIGGSRPARPKRSRWGRPKRWFEALQRPVGAAQRDLLGPDGRDPPVRASGVPSSEIKNLETSR